MRDTNVKTWLVALLVALLPCVAGAAGLGRITVLTAIGQPLIAEIELVAVTPQELSSLSARLALPDTYRQANLQYNVALTGARLTIEKRPDGQPFLKIASTRAGQRAVHRSAGRTDLGVRAPVARVHRVARSTRNPAVAPAPSISAAPESVVAPAPTPQPPATIEPSHGSAA